MLLFLVQSFSNKLRRANRDMKWGHWVHYSTNLSSQQLAARRCVCKWVCWVSVCMCIQYMGCCPISESLHYWMWHHLMVREAWRFQMVCCYDSSHPLLLCELFILFLLLCFKPIHFTLMTMQHTIEDNILKDTSLRQSWSEWRHVSSQYWVLLFFFKSRGLGQRRDKWMNKTRVSGA